MWTILIHQNLCRIKNLDWRKITHCTRVVLMAFKHFASDIYSMGLLAWELLTGQKASPSGTLPNGRRVDWYMQEMWHREEPLTDPRVFQSDIPRWLIVCIQTFTNKDPRKRPQNANDALQLWLQGSSGRLISQENLHMIEMDYLMNHRRDRYPLIMFQMHLLTLHFKKCISHLPMYKRICTRTNPLSLQSQVNIKARK